MSCVLRISGATLLQGSFAPYRFENGVAHFEVSSAAFEDLAQQAEDAIAFLKSNERDLKRWMRAGANGVLDFAVEWRDVAVQSDTFPAELVQAAGALGLSLALSHYPKADPLTERTEG